ncbi:hypothetical protein AAFM71_10875 [Chromobacterium violaceum]|uniref:hypothetical protein n=1 Tax=Chromobacterium violaceum TaxID=536 RepID=UPI003858370F
MTTFIFEELNDSHRAVDGMTAEQIEHYVRLGVAACNCQQIMSTRPGAVCDAAGGTVDDDGEFTASAISFAGARYEGVTIVDVLLHVYEADCMPKEGGMRALDKTADTAERLAGYEQRPEVVALLEIWKSWLGSDYESCAPGGPAVVDQD